MSNSKITKTNTSSHKTRDKNGAHATEKTMRGPISRINVKIPAKQVDVDELPIPEFFDEEEGLHDWPDSATLAMLASEDAFARTWNTAEEDEAWADL